MSSARRVPIVPTASRRISTSAARSGSRTRTVTICLWLAGGFESAGLGKGSCARSCSHSDAALGDKGGGVNVELVVCVGVVLDEPFAGGIECSGVPIVDSSSVFRLLVTPRRSATTSLWPPLSAHSKALYSV